MEEAKNQYDGSLVGYVEKGKTQRIYLGVREYQGKRFVDIRQYYLASEEWKPTQKGLTFPVETYTHFAERVEELGIVLMEPRPQS